MKKYICLYAMVVFLAPLTLLAQEYQAHFPPEEFEARRDKVFDAIGDQAVAVIQGAPDPGGFIYPRQTNTFYYLSGVENSYAYLVLDGRSRTTTLYLPPSRISGDGRVLSINNPERAKELTGIESVLSANDMEISRVRTIYTMFSPAENQGQSRGELRNRNRMIVSDSFDGRISRENHLAGLLRTRYARSEIKDLTSILDELRTIKSPLEIELLRRAGRLGALALIEAMKSTKPGVYEYELDAAARYIYLINGARLEGYRSITAAGAENIIDAHYFYNSSVLKDGDLLLMDYAPDYGYYTTDIGRMWPINGTFNDMQRELVQFILDYHNEVLSRIRPGVTAQKIMDDAKVAMERVFERTTFSKPVYETAARRLVDTGGGVFSHTVGMAVHDVGGYRSAPLKVGQVFSVDPQLRVPEEGLYMRIEDTIVVTENGIENLTGLAPSELDEIENLIGEGGIVQKLPGVIKK